MALRKTTVDTLVHDYGRIRVYRDDLAEMVKVLRDVASNCHLRADDYELDDVDDLSQLADKGITRVVDFVFSADGNRVGLSVNKRRALLAVREPDLIWRGAAAEVERIAKRCGGPRLAASVDTRTRAEAPTFWSRKKDDILIAVASGAIFLVLGFVLGRLYA
ncbi:MAG TPA: hypothetical protein VES42_19765 [Pilimelia sp.]|nr:hypothetical protein [Pilimelia sp.]